MNTRWISSLGDRTSMSSRQTWGFKRIPQKESCSMSKSGNAMILILYSTNDTEYPYAAAPLESHNSRLIGKCLASHSHLSS